MNSTERGASPASSIRVYLAIATLLLAAQLNAAQSPGTEQLDNAVRDLVAFAPSDGDQPLVYEQAERVRQELGAVIDPRPEDGGLPRVMAVTPGGASERMDLRAGDRLLRVNGSDLVAGEPAAEALRQAIHGDRDSIELQVQRGAEQLAISGLLERVAIPGYKLSVTPSATSSGCGRINLAIDPPLSQSLHPLVLHTIDGRLGGPLTGNDVYRLSAGRHVIKVSEQIRADRFSGGETAQRNTLHRRNRANRFKHFELDVEPNTTYRLGVRFIKDKVDPVSDQAYWEPVVWKSFEEKCR